MVDENEAVEVEETPEEEPEATEEPDEQESEAFDPEKAREKIRKLNSESRNLRKRATEAEAKAQEAEGKGKRAQELEAENMRLRIAVKHGLPEALVKRLSGSTEEEILQDAEELMDLFGGRKPPSNTPKEKLRAPSSHSDSAEVDVEKAVEEAFKH